MNWHEKWVWKLPYCPQHCFKQSFKDAAKDFYNSVTKNQNKYIDAFNLLDDAGKRVFYYWIKGLYELNYEYISNYSYIRNSNRQYRSPFFDFANDEILVNCGCCDGKTLLDFYQYNGDSFSKLIGIDCVKKNIFNSTSLMIQNNVPKNRYEILYYALGEREDTIFVKDEGMYRASEKGKPNGSEVKQVTLDNLFKNKKPYTFLALDTEGFEMGILKGSEKIIKEAKPKLAISIYHRFDDIFEIILYLHKLNPQYKFSAICDWENNALCELELLCK